MNIAAIDIGTNTILMLIASVESDYSYKIIDERYYVARLGENVDKVGMIIPQAIERASAILKECYEICKQNKVERVFSVGTSALRDAQNSAEVISIFNKIISAEIKVIPGEEEARLSYLGTVSDDDLSFVIDIGGGSTELIIGKNQKIIKRMSLNIGAVRLTERYFDSQPPSPENIFQAKLTIENELNKFEMNFDNFKTYASAGTATSIATTALDLPDYEVKQIHNFLLNNQKLNNIFDNYKISTSDYIIEKYKIHPKRADLITAGALILKTIFEYFRISECTISAHGLRYGVLIDALKKLELHSI